MNSPLHPILHSEEEANDIFLLQAAFANAGVWNPIHVVKTAASAFAYLLGESTYARRTYYPMPELILLDPAMQSSGGLEILKWRQLHREIKVIPVLVLTSAMQPDEVNAAYLAGANGYLAKPASVVSRK